MKRRLFLTLMAAMLMPFVMNAQQHVFVTTAAEACGSYTWSVNGNTYTISNDYAYTSNDTTFVLHLTINPVYLTPLTTSYVNGGCTYTFGDTILADDGAYTRTLQTTKGCDSAASIVLTTASSATVSYTKTACASYTWKDSTYTTSTVVNKTEHVDNCDSILTLNLTIIQPTQIATDTAVSGCEQKYFRFSPSFPSRSILVTTTTTITTDDYAGDPTSAYYSIFHGRTTDRCFDSVRTAVITINYATYDHRTISACDEYVFTYGDDNTKTYSETVTDTVRVGANVYTCDSSVILNLTVHQSPVVTIEGDLSVVPGNDAVLTASCNQYNVNFLWSNGQNTQTITVPKVEENTDISVEATNTSTGCKGSSYVTILANVGINDVDGANINIFPNPATNVINVESSNEVSNIVVYNTVGQRVISIDNANRIDVSNLSNGTYAMRITLADGNIITRKFVVTK